MIILTLENNKIGLDGFLYSFDDVALIDENLVNVHLFTDVYNFIYALVANDVTINGVLQTSGQMIFDTLNGQS
jgi:hypothetical protein